MKVKNLGLFLILSSLIMLSFSVFDVITIETVMATETQKFASGFEDGFSEWTDTYAVNGLGEVQSNIKHGGVYAMNATAIPDPYRDPCFFWARKDLGVNYTNYHVRDWFSPQNAMVGEQDILFSVLEGFCYISSEFRDTFSVGVMNNTVDNKLYWNVGYWAASSWKEAFLTNCSELLPTVWYQIDVYHYMGNNGNFTLRIGGVTFLSSGSFSGEDGTRPAANWLWAGIFNFNVGILDVSFSVQHDDITFWELIGSPPQHLTTSSSYPAAVGSVNFTINGVPHSTPYSENLTEGTYNFTCTTFQYSPNSSYRYTFDYWTINGTGNYGSLSITVSITGETNLTIVYKGSEIPPSYPFIYAKNALNATWYMRSDTHTIAEILGYKLLTVNTATPAFDERLHDDNCNVSYGVRVWAIGLLENQYELTSGYPVAVVTKTTEGEEMMQGYWTCPAYGSMINAIMVKVYQKFEDEAWSLRKIFITQSNLLIRLPSSTWTFHYYIIRTLGSTNSTFGFGSYTTYNSRVDLQYYKASPWDVALARLWQRNFVGFLFTPWTYWFGDLFWTICLFGCIVFAYLRTGSFKPVLGILWILGGSGSILWALIPAAALHVAVIMLALAMAITLFRLFHR